MSDTPQGPGWWQASDDRWYPPPRPEVPGDDPAGLPPGPSAGSPQTPTSAGPPGTPPGGLSGAPQIRPTHQTPLLIALAVIGVIAVVVLVFVMVSDGREEGQETSTTGELPMTTEAPETSDTVDEEPDETVAPTSTTETDPEEEGSEEGAPSEGEELGDGIVLLEYGHGTVPSLGGRGRNVTIGMIIQNTGDEVRSPSIEWITYDESGSLLDNNRVSAFTIQPGETLGLGDTSLAAIDQEPAELEIRYQGDMGFSTTDTSGSVTVSNVESTSDESTGFVNVTFEAESSYGEDIDDAYAHVIYRNSAGEIAGGKLGGSFGFIPANGSRAGQVQSGADLRELDVDLEQTEVYVDAAYDTL